MIRIGDKVLMRYGNGSTSINEIIHIDSKEAIQYVLDNEDKVVLIRNKDQGFGKLERVISNHLTGNIEYIEEYTIKYCPYCSGLMYRVLIDTDSKVICDNCDYEKN